jgi:ABC-2 type transport system permease protein
MTERNRPRVGMLKTAGAFMRVDYIEEINYPATFVMRILAVLVPLIPFFFISELVGDSPTVGGDYLTFSVIGLGVTTLLTAGMSGYGGSLQNALQRGTLETFLIEPIPWTMLPLAMNQWHVLFGIFSALLVFGAGILLGAEFVTGGLGAAVLIGVLGLISAAAIGIVSAAVLLLTLKSAPVLRLYTMASSILAGSIFSVDQLPSWLMPLAYLIPHTYAINGMRSVLMSDPGTFDMSASTAIWGLLIFDVLIFPLGLLAFGRALEYSRKTGGLGGY